MITTTMTLEEIAKELLTDFCEVRNRWKKFENKFKRMCLSQTKFPWFWETTIKTKRYNEWNILFSAWSKKETNILDPSFIVHFRYNGGLWSACLYENFVSFYPIHFFERYKERFLKLSSVDTQLSNKDIRNVFYTLNNRISIYKKTKEDSIRGFCYNGMVLGDWLDDRCGIVKTFISIEEMKVNQFSEYFEYLKYSLILDMYRCRKGSSVISGSDLIECIPDTYLEYDEMNRFLWKLENPLLIKTHGKCVDYYSEHKLEVDKCIKLLDSVNNNYADKMNL